MQDKVCVITGANSGIGKFTTLEIAKKGARIVMVCRNAEKGEHARKEIILESKNPKVDLFVADFSVQQSIREAAQKIRGKYPEIDVLVNNAGFIAKSYREITVDGFESTFAVNHLGYFMLTNLLKESLRAGKATRIVNVSSTAHRFTKIDFDNLQLETGYAALKAYALSKLCNILFTRELAKRLEGTGMTANCLHPGGVSTNFANDTVPWMKKLYNFGRPFLLSSAKGAATSIYLASDPAVGKISGEYFVKRKIALTSTEARSEEKALHLWEMSAKMTELEGQTF